MPRRKFAVGDLVKHRETGDAIFVIESWLEPVDQKIETLYQCSLVNGYHFGWHGYAESLLTKAGDVEDERKPDAIKRAAMILYRLVESAQEGGMRHRRAEQLHEEFCDHWLQNDNPEKMELLSNTLDHIEELLKKTRNKT